MLPKSVSPRFAAWVGAVIVGLLLACIVFLERPLCRLFAIPFKGYKAIPIGCAMFLSHILASKALQYLGIEVRSRSVQRFQPARRDAEAVAVDLPIRIAQSQWLIWGMSAGFFLGGFIFLLPLWNRDPVHDPTAVLACGLVLMIVGLIMTRARPSMTCEITEKGILAPAGTWGGLRFVPWEELVRCEIIRDDEQVGDYFVLWDRKGRCPFKSKSWIGDVGAANRARIYRALMSRFPEKAKADGDIEPAILQAAASAVWDRELDG
jgi:hypothetical protein